MYNFLPKPGRGQVAMGASVVITYGLSCTKVLKDVGAPLYTHRHTLSTSEVMVPTYSRTCLNGHLYRKAISL